jgi:lipoprotein-anchoring transpeptidase ErfK/SrfK
MLKIKEILKRRRGMKLSVFFLVLFSIFVFWTEGDCQDIPVPTTSQRYSLKIGTSQCRLWLYEEQAGGQKLIKEYPVGTVKVGLKQFPLGKGCITDIDFAPVWRPTAYSRWFFANKLGINLPGTVAFGHKLNFMGQFRISLSHSVPGKGQVYRIHGVRPGEEKYVGTRVSGGCIRMRNEEGLEIARMVSIGTPVVIIP